MDRSPAIFVDVADTGAFRLRRAGLVRLRRVLEVGTATCWNARRDGHAVCALRMPNWRRRRVNDLPPDRAIIITHTEAPAALRVSLTFTAGDLAAQFRIIATIAYVPARR